MILVAALLAAAPVFAQEPIGTPGFTEPERTVAVAAAESGILAELLVRPGDRVAAGTPLGRLDAAGLEEAKSIAEARAAATAARDAAVIEREKARRRLAKFEAVGAERLGSRDELETARADAALAEVRVRQTEEDAALAALEVVRIAADLDRRTVRAPFEGTVVEVSKEIGEAVPASDPALLVLARLDTLRAVFHPSASRASRLRKGDAVAVAIPAEVAGEPVRTVRATVDFVSPITDAESGTVRIEALIPNADRRLRAGSRVTLTEGEPPRAVAADDVSRTGDRR
ncbi:hypothetical protein LzC2_38550 [Planctomycetes bacterium LzC2]|uniref:RND efflux pump membrane fusion protein barrel-sandwich domain-containing protein n=2 Tax=Alienimonas chondri TaxID=2681879 RepID=A0ABX1VI13_9PLAN|nr:hypothetical protein [Alienimonas chondri]